MNKETKTTICFALKEDPSVSDGQRLSILEMCEPPGSTPGSIASRRTNSAISREDALDHVFGRPLWDEHDLATVFDAAIDTVRHMKSRDEIPGIVQVNQRCWRVHRDAFLEHFKLRGMPKRPRGRPRASSVSGECS